MCVCLLAKKDHWFKLCVGNAENHTTITAATSTGAHKHTFTKIYIAADDTVHTHSLALALCVSFVGKWCVLCFYWKRHVVTDRDQQHRNCNTQSTIYGQIDGKIKRIKSWSRRMANKQIRTLSLQNCMRSFRKVFIIFNRVQMMDFNQILKQSVAFCCSFVNALNQWMIAEHIALLMVANTIFECSAGKANVLCNSLHSGHFCVSIDWFVADCIMAVAMRL